MKPNADNQWEGFCPDRVPVEEWAGELYVVAG